MQNEKNEKDKKKKKSKSSNICGKKSLVKYRLLCLTPSIHCCLTSTLSSRAGRHVGISANFTRRPFSSLSVSVH